jgi:LDH2 family malate/lactate/ureidoglycolate dehydrogenase
MESSPVGGQRHDHNDCMASTLATIAQRWGHPLPVELRDRAGICRSWSNCCKRPLTKTSRYVAPSPPTLHWLSWQLSLSWVDICASIATTSMTRQKYAAGELFEPPWLLDAQGNPTRDPAVLEHSGPGSCPEATKG